MSNLPEGSNFFASLKTQLSTRRVARLFSSAGWQVRQCGQTDYELRSEIAELVLDDASPPLLHGSVADPQLNVDRVLAPLREAGVSFDCECYSASGELMQSYCS